MITTVVQNTPTQINLLDFVNDNGWSFNGTQLLHEMCNTGSIISKISFTTGTPYTIEIKILSISDGYLQVDFGTSSQQYTTVGLKSLSVSSTSPNAQLILTSNANLVIDIISVKDETEIDKTDSTEHTVYSFDAQKWTRYDNYYPDFGLSMFTKLYSFKDGQMYSHTDKVNKVNFYGDQFESRIRFQEVQPKVVTYQGIKIECNKLLITTTDGIETSLGQVSDLIEQDFEMFNLNDGVTQISVYDYEGNYRANFLRAKPDLNFGDRLKGRYITIELTTKDDRDFNLYKVVVQYNISTPNE